ncbi:MAG: alpha/beta fold hydrolase [Paludibacterium sp.]|uniref:alpha/beta hydrolase n=1 Tax=Paludibacterium sp. TaxID=1917523 RepID=UPI0025EF987D|nr:alpha/beta fold hydrolase [Paludibacterium sp.]MBV8048247.1 alpha/beta fold hydrolase [Paludibacterium sp.]MBV8648208.1 alpha/beta fold hydrolase [Paludibacterium sp.]
MAKSTQSVVVDGPVGDLDTLFLQAEGECRGVAVICHPNPTQGGTNTNKVVQTTAKALSQLGYACYCPNLRGVGASQGEHDHGDGEVDDVLAVVERARADHGDLPLVLAGFSFGGFVAARARERIEADKLLLIGVAVGKYALPTPPVPADTLVIHGEEDDVVPLADVLAWARPQSLPVTVFPGVGHFFHGRLVELANFIKQRF